MTETLTTFFALMAIAGGCAVVGVALAAAVSATGNAAAGRLLNQIRPTALGLAFLAAATCMAGSLYYSEVAGYDPCRLCWVQRFFMYPAAIVLGIALVTRRPKLGWLAAGLSVGGLGVAVYHRLEQAFPDSVGGACSLDNPCSGRYVNEFDFVTIPTMAGVGFAMVITFTLLSLWPTRVEELSPSADADRPESPERSLV